MKINYDLEGIVFDIQRFSIHDGPGIRTIVFLKGCPLSCWWCCNPEAQSLKPLMMYQVDRCVHCGLCLPVCPQGALSSETDAFIDREKCIGCGACAKICPTEALVLKGKKMTVNEVVDILKKDEAIYRHSNGGITISGGEALVQYGFTTELLKACKINGWHTAVETTGYIGSESAINEVFSYLDLALLDVKSYNDEIHKKYTGVSNALIHKNAKIIAGMTKTVVRVPTIPGVNANEKEIRAICGFAATLKGVDTIHLLPYHTYGENKYELLGRPYKLEKTPSLTEPEIDALEEVVKSCGFHCVIGG
ncbi:glycyl-radical enzyme activating protein [Acetobacterium paludosum]|uniref:Glycyl-radical enzyme activating protein n=1 Tax=Acetobacterium paludosum TaxID=52693 RepID=A0A923HVB8_9FIRM|nr:glycyl-radical enzyme activating protein [Acetobacterium paludosum]MBC3887920.1 glycyl-radical enzyme activating protein [Acetobacterium paludosum]